MKVRISSLESSFEKIIHLTLLGQGKLLYIFRIQQLNKDITHKFYLKSITEVLFEDSESSNIISSNTVRWTVRSSMYLPTFKFKNPSTLIKGPKRRIVLWLWLQVLHSIEDIIPAFIILQEYKWFSFQIVLVKHVFI